MVLFLLHPPENVSADAYACSVANKCYFLVSTFAKPNLALLQKVSGTFALDLFG